MTTRFVKDEPVYVVLPNGHVEPAHFVAQPVGGYALVIFKNPGYRNPTTDGIDTVDISRVHRDLIYHNYDRKRGDTDFTIFSGEF